MNNVRRLVLVTTWLVAMVLVLTQGRLPRTAADLAGAKLYLPVVCKSLWTAYPPTPTPTATTVIIPWTCSEPANDRQEGACGPLVFGQVYHEYISSDADYDWFYFDMPAAHTIQAWLTGIPPDCDYDLQIRDMQGTRVAYEPQEGSQDEDPVSALLPAGRYFALAYWAKGGFSASSPYSLRVSFVDAGSTATPTCTPSPTATHTPTASPTSSVLQCPEPDNDGRTGACGPLASGQAYHGTISSSADASDWFYFDMPAAHTIEARLAEIPVGSDYDLYLTDASGTTLAGSTGTGQEEYISWGPIPAGRYYLAVLSWGGSWNASEPYALRVDY